MKIAAQHVAPGVACCLLTVLLAQGACGTAMVREILCEGGVCTVSCQLSM